LHAFAVDVSAAPQEHIKETWEEDAHVSLMAVPSEGEEKVKLRKLRPLSRICLYDVRNGSLLSTSSSYQSRAMAMDNRC
jgi:hypothetical protein